MTRAQRRPNNPQRCLEWAEYLFWLIPIAVVAAIVTIQAVVIHFLLRVIKFLCRIKSESTQAQIIPIYTVATVPKQSSLARPRKTVHSPAQAYSLCPTSTFPFMLKRSGKGRFSRVSPPHLLSQDHVCEHNLSVPRFPGAKIPGRSDTRRF